VGDQAERERRHLSHFGISIREQRNHRLNALNQSDAPDSKHRTTAYARLRIDEQLNQIGGGGPRVDGRGLRRWRLDEGRRRRIRIAQDPLIFEPDYPGEFLFLRDIRWCDGCRRDNDGDRSRRARRNRKRKAEL